ncbi:MAG: dienelactone hydrolase family protein [Gammaproteobacteria bacterium]|jgi:carboxymethylenebutenolidase|nr:dienelactone hydrolase family protein [Gammaproteobacteria bacterium]MBT4494087.1 dienelactone hydrolase family protein [Gammaproteobacteria bacterium]MBT7369328.1 dienelactone hydrolase family protein [Gammaproteobacteria bacterium]
MNEFQVDVRTPDGEMDCFVCHPDEGPRPAVLFYMDVPGIREELREMCRHIADQGYVAILPDLYYRDGKVRFDLSKGQEELQRMFAMGSKLSVEMVARDTSGLIDYCRQSDLITEKVGCIGYCMSGQFVVAAAGNFPDDIKAAASLYGTRIVTENPDSPHLLADRIQAELYLGFAEHDPYVEDFVIPDLTGALDEQGVAYQCEIHPGTEHGFCFGERPAYHEEAAQKVWDRVFEMYSRTLK